MNNSHNPYRSNRTIDDVLPPQPIRETAEVKPEIHHIPVGEPVEVKTKYSPLSSYTDNSKYFNTAAHLAPKRPLGQPLEASRPAPHPTPVKTTVERRQPEPVFYDRMPGYADASLGLGLADRIRRPVRPTNYETAPAGATHKTDHDNHFSTAALTASVAAFFTLISHKIAAAYQDVLQRTHNIRAFKPRVHYDAFRGAVVRRFAMRESWLKLAAPAFILACLLAVGIFHGLLAPGSRIFNPLSGNSSTSSSDSGNNGSSQGSNVTGTGSSANSSSTNGGSSSAQNTQNATNGGRVQGATGSASQVQPSAAPSGGSGVPVGGRGAGGTSGSTVPISSSGAPAAGGGGTSTPIISTGSNTPSQALPLPAGTGSVVPNTPLPLPATVTVPPNNTSLGGKTLVDTPGTGVTLN